MVSCGPGPNQDAILATIGSQIRRRRQELGFTQVELAERAGLERVYLNRIEHGARNPSVLALAKMAHAMDTTMTSLICGL